MSSAIAEPIFVAVVGLVAAFLGIRLLRLVSSAARRFVGLTPRSAERHAAIRTLHAAILSSIIALVAATGFALSTGAPSLDSLLLLSGFLALGATVYLSAEPRGERSFGKGRPFNLRTKRR